MPNSSHALHLTSWVESANDPASDFPIQNLPLGAFEAEHDGHSHGHLCTAIGDQILDISMLGEAGYFSEDAELDEALLAPYWIGFTDQPALITKLRQRLQAFLSAGSTGGQQARRLRDKALRPLSETQLMPGLPIFNYTDFYASIHHAATVGAMFRPDNPLLPNYKYVPIGYHGRASSIVVSGADIRRPVGQQAPPDSDPKAPPAFGPCKMLDYELELACIIGPGNHLGDPVPISKAREQIFGLCLLNDWSARDIQKSGGFDINLEAYLQSADMLKRGLAPLRLSTGSAKDLYWTFGQMIAHHTSNGCNLQPGDVLGSGVVSGSSPDSRGCLLELTWDGTGPDGKPKPRKPLQLPTGETRTFLADGDTVIFKAYCERDGFRRIGFGECRGTIVPAKG